MWGGGGGEKIAKQSIVLKSQPLTSFFTTQPIRHSRGWPNELKLEEPDELM